MKTILNKEYNISLSDFIQITHRQNEFNMRPRVYCRDGFNISIQGNSGAYSEPRATVYSYTRMELGFPSEAEPLLESYAEDKSNLCDTIYPYVPFDDIQVVIEKHGGIDLLATMNNQVTLADRYKSLSSDVAERFSSFIKVTGDKVYIDKELIGEMGEDSVDAPDSDEFMEAIEGLPIVELRNMFGEVYDVVILAVSETGLLYVSELYNNNQMFWIRFSDISDIRQRIDMLDELIKLR